MSSRLIWFILVVLVLILVLPLPIAERYTSPTQDGQYTVNPVKAYRFVLAAARVSPNSELNTSGKALQQAKRVFTGQLRPTKVELLFFPESGPYSYTTTTGRTLTVENPGEFVWEVWGMPVGTSNRVQADVIGFLDYETGDLLASAGE